MQIHWKEVSVNLHNTKLNTSISLADRIWRNYIYLVSQWNACIQFSIMQIYTDLFPANLQMAEDVFFTFSMLAAALWRLCTVFSKMTDRDGIINVS